jgi:hypothetical protein
MITYTLGGERKMRAKWSFLENLEKLLKEATMCAK